MTEAAASADLRSYLRSPGLLALFAALVLAHAGLLAAVVGGWPWFFLGCLVVATAADVVIRAIGGLPTRVLYRARMDAQDRHLFRELTTLAMLARSVLPGAGGVALAVVILVLTAVRVAWLLVLVPMLWRGLTPVETRNIDLSGVPEAGIADRRLRREGSAYLLVATMTPPVLVALAAALAAPWPLVAVSALSVLPFAVHALRVLLAALRLLRAPSRRRYLQQVNARVQALRPEVVLYFSGDADAIYQVNMWLAVLDRTRRPTLVVLRERAILAELGPTSSPVVCIPNAVDFMTFPLDTVRVALYVANVGKNIHLLRLPGIKHVFIGHGDSDKLASVNPFTKVHDEVWVAGEAGRERYRVAKVGVRDDSIVEVGRPQLGTIFRGPRRADRGEPVTVLYAPTWEGWTGDPFHTSLVLMGPRIVAALLSRDDVRVLYKPHPLTGHVQAAARTAHAQIVELLDAAVARRGAAGRAWRADDAPLHPAATVDEEERLYREWSEQWWARCEPWRHIVVTEGRPTLYDCFNSSDVLVSDISSVVADWVASSKPYAVANPAGLPGPAFRVRYPTARAAYLVAPDLTGLDAAIDAVRGADPLREERESLRAYLLGADDRDPMERWNAEVDRLVAEAHATWPDAHPWAEAAEMPEDPATRPVVLVGDASARGPGETAESHERDEGDAANGGAG